MSCTTVTPNIRLASQRKKYHLLLKMGYKFQTLIQSMQETNNDRENYSSEVETQKTVASFHVEICSHWHLIMSKHCFTIVKLICCAGSCIATTRASHSGLVEGEKAD
jgi:hypothetical protein